MDNNFQRSFSYVNLKKLPSKPRAQGITEVRGPYYEAFSVSQLEGLLNTWGYYIDGFKFAGGTQALLSSEIVKSFTRLAHQHKVYVNTGGFIERVIIQGPKNIDRYLEETRDLGFDVVEVSSGMFEHASDFKLEDQINIVKKIKQFGLQPKPEITLMTGVGGGTKHFEHPNDTNKIKSIKQLVNEAEQFFEAGARMLMVESEGITEGFSDVTKWRTDVIFTLIEKFGLEKLMFEISPEDDEARKTFKWYIKNISPYVNLMMNAKNIVEFNAWRLGLWGDMQLWQDQKIVF